ncbi:MAG TPA: DNA-3-methyladenine glycosylase [Polyangia bacterium]|nr:DNA-3-methyladenine glycosylase [Polyangia bacterium]
MARAVSAFGPAPEPTSVPFTVPAIPLPRAFYERPTTAVARELLGKVLVRHTPAGATLIARIVEVEAYLGERDAASHARRGPTPRAAIMFGPPGFLYVYLIYGMHNCMNFVTEADGKAGAVLIRAATPLAGFPAIPLQKKGPLAGRSTPPRTIAAGRSRSSLTRPLTGPGKLCAALGITRGDLGHDLTRPGAFYVADDGSRPPRRATSARVGVDYAGAWAARKLRFYVAGSPDVSKP